MHKKHLLPGFDDREAEEMAIQLLTGEITQLMHKCQQRVVKLGQLKQGISEEQLRSPATCFLYRVSVVWLTCGNCRLKQNMRLSLAGELQELSASFRNSQKSYLKSTCGFMSWVVLRGCCADTEG